MVASLALWLLLLLPVVPAKRMAEALLPNAEPVRVLFAALWIYLFVIQTQVMVLGCAGLLTLPWMLAAGVIVLGASLMLPVRAPGLDVGEMLRERFACATPPERMAALFLFLPVVYALIRLAGDGPYFMWDDWAYHGKVVTDMMRTDSIVFFRNNFAMYYPFNPHLLMFFTTLATGDLQWVWLPTVYFICVGSVSWMVLALAAPRRCVEFMMLAGAVFGLSQEVRWFQNAFCSTDVFGAIALFSAFAVAKPRLGANDGEVRANALLCGMIVGYAIGTKNFFVVPGIAAALTCLYWSTWGRRAVERAAIPHLRMGAQVLGMGFLGVWITGSFWYLYNVAIAGNPVFPVKMLGFDGTVKTKYFARTTMVHFGEKAHWSWDFWRDALKQWLLWPEPHGVLLNLGLVGGIVVCAVVAVRVWRGRVRMPVPLGMMPGMLTGAFILLGAYPFLPYSGTFIGTDYLVISRRYLLFCFMVSLAFWAYLAGTRLRGGHSAGRILRIVFYLLLAFEWPLVVWYRDYLYLTFIKFLPTAPFVSFNLLEAENGIAWQLGNNWPNVGWDVYGLATAVIAVVLAVPVRLAPALLQRLAMAVRGRWPLAIGLGAALLVLLVARPMLFHAPSYRTFYPRWDTVRLARLANAVDHLPKDSRVGALGASSWEQWYLHGSCGQLQPVYLNNNGRPLLELHEAHARGIIDPDDSDTHPRVGVPYRFDFPRPDLFAERLAEGRLDYLVVTQYIGTEWPPQREALAKLADYRRIWDDGYSEIYQHVQSPDEPLTVLPAPELLEQRPPRM